MGCFISVTEWSWKLFCSVDVGWEIRGVRGEWNGGVLFGFRSLGRVEHKLKFVVSFEPFFNIYPLIIFEKREKV